MARSSPTRNDTEKRSIGAAVRRARTARGLTMVQLAATVGVSQSFISQMETGRAAPSMATLYRLAEALEVPMSALLPTPESTTRDRVSVVRAGGGTQVPFPSGDQDLMAHHLGRGGDSLISPFLFELPAGYEDPKLDPDPYRHPGEAFLHLLRGTLDVEIGEHTTRMHVGDSVHHDASLPHRWIVVGDEPALLLDVEVTIEIPPFITS